MNYRIFHSLKHNLIQMKEAVTKDIGETDSKDIDMLQWCSAAALELIGQAGM
jgi:hypothetical protein